MKRSAINRAFLQAGECFRRNGWALPPNPQWDITDFGLGEFERHGLVAINLANEAEYCEKLMYAARQQTTPCHTHRSKKEDIICRFGTLGLWLWPERPAAAEPVAGQTVTVPINGLPVVLPSGVRYVLPAGSRVTLQPGVWHAFAPTSEECIIGEVSTANDDAHDNFFLNPAVGRYPGIEEDTPSLIRLLSEA